MCPKNIRKWLFCCDAVMQLPLNVMVMDLNLGWQGS